MQAVVGIFDSIQHARRAAADAFRAVPSSRLRLVSPEAARDEIETLPTDEAEQPGMGAAVGGVVGGAVGAAVASLVAPPVGLVAIVSIASGALLGAGGGALAGGSVEEALSFGLPRDELEVYREAVRRGRSLRVAAVDETEEADRLRETLAAAGAMSVDAARKDWRVGLGETE